MAPEPSGAHRLGWLKAALMYDSVARNVIRKTVLLLALVFTQCSRSTDKVMLGPVPFLNDPLVRRIVGDMRTWVENFRPSDATKLKTTGKIVFSWQEVTTSYSEQARILDDYEEQRRLQIVDSLKEDSQPIPVRLAEHHSPDTVTVSGGSGEYVVRLVSSNGVGLISQQISTKLLRKS